MRRVWGGYWQRCCFSCSFRKSNILFIDQIKGNKENPRNISSNWRKLVDKVREVNMTKI